MFCQEVMSRNRFLCILKFLRFSLYALVTKDPRTRTEPFLDLLQQRSQSLVRPSRHVAVDEALMLWRGCLGFQQFIK